MALWTRAAAMLLVPLVCTPACGGSDPASDAGSAGDGGTVPRDQGPDLGDEGGVPLDAGQGCSESQALRTETETGLRVVHHDGQSFVSWRDRAEGEEGAHFRYQLYRSTEAITAENLAEAELVDARILNHSGQLFGEAFRPHERLEGESPMAIVEEGGTPLAPWSGLAVTSARRTGCAYFAVLAYDLRDETLEAVVPGDNATREAIAEQIAPHEPMLRFDSNDRGRYTPQTRVTGTPNLPLLVRLHASNATGGGAGEYGDYYSYFGDERMGYRDGMAGVFSVEETHSGPQYLMMRNRDTIVAPDGSRGVETHWFGYVHDDEAGGERYAHPYTERRLEWMIPWVIERYAVDRNRVYGTGGSMGAWGTMTFSFRHAELFAAVYANRPRFYQRNLASLSGSVDESLTLPDGTPWTEHHDSVAFVRSHGEDLPFLGWNCGRHDGFASWQEQIDMVRALEAMHHGFAFAWNNGDHSTGARSAEAIEAWYPKEKFALDESYPAFANSSINDRLGNGDPEDGDLEGGINLGFDWVVEEDSSDTWQISLRNALAEDEMRVDVTPRRVQAFQLEAGTEVAYRIEHGDGTEQGTVRVDPSGHVTLVNVALFPGMDTRITLLPAE